MLNNLRVDEFLATCSGQYARPHFSLACCIRFYVYFVLYAGDCEESECCGLAEITFYQDLDWWKYSEGTQTLKRVDHSTENVLLSNF